MRWTRTDELPARTTRAEPAPAVRVWAGRIPVVLAAWAPVGALVVVTLALNLWRAGAVSVWYDEAWTYGLASQRPHVMLKYIGGKEANMALYYFFMHIWLGLLGALRVAPVEWLLRLPSAVFVALSAGVVFLIGYRWFNTTTAAVGGALYALNFLVLYDGNLARSYALQMLLITGGWYTLFAALTAKTGMVRRRWWVAYAALMTLAIYAQFVSLLVLAAQAAALALLLVVPGPWRTSARAAWRPAVLAVAAACVLSAPILYAASRFGDLRGFIPVPTVADVFTFVVTMMQGDRNATLRALSLPLVGLAVLAAAAAWAPWSRWLPAARLAEA
jgi:mannosyltransferase